MLVFKHVKVFTIIKLKAHLPTYSQHAKVKAQEVVDHLASFFVK